MALHSDTLRTISSIFQRLDYRSLGKIYCDEGGDVFWAERRGPAEQLGITLATVLKSRLQPKGRSLYVGAGVAEIPALAMEILELHRSVAAYNLRTREVEILNDACAGLPFVFLPGDARTSTQQFDHLWIVSVLNDPECFPELGSLSSGWANPVTFDPEVFAFERSVVHTLAAGCLEKLVLPGLVTTSVEELPWITHWCEQRNAPCTVEEQEYPTAIVEDPVCFVKIG